jgi:hypothetical protein
MLFVGLMNEWRQVPKCLASRFIAGSSFLCALRCSVATKISRSRTGTGFGGSPDPPWDNPENSATFREGLDEPRQSYYYATFLLRCLAEIRAGIVRAGFYLTKRSARFWH